MIYGFFDINTLDEKTTAKYYPLLSEKRKKTIENLPTAKERCTAFCSDILVRGMLSELLDAPEFSFELLLNPNGRSAVGNYDANVSLCMYGDILGCAVSKKRIGMSIEPVTPLNFAELQSSLSDSEIRDVFAQSGYSYCELLKMKEYSEEKVNRRACGFFAMKKAYFKTKGKLLNNNMLSAEFSFNGKGFECSDGTVTVSAFDFDNTDGYVYAVTEEHI